MRRSQEVHGSLEAEDRLAPGLPCVDVYDVGRENV
jgi:hypothetical protein